jgi:hypothetical protein
MLELLFRQNTERGSHHAGPLAKHSALTVVFSKAKIIP